METNLLKDELFQFMNTLDLYDVNKFVSNSIRECKSNCKTIIKYACLLGSNMTNPLQVSIKYNNLLCTIECIRQGADVHHRIDGSTYIHISVIENNINLLKFFLSKNIDVNLYNDHEYTAADLALVFKHYECYELLLNKGAYIFNKKQDIHHLSIVLEEYEPKLNPLISQIIEKIEDTISLNEEMFDIIKKIILKNHYDIVILILCSLSSFANTVIKGNTLTGLLIARGATVQANKVLNNKTTNLNPQGIDSSYLNIACKVGDLNIIDYLLTKKPDLIKNKCDEDKTPIDHVLMGYSNYTLEECQHTIKLLLTKTEKNILNNRNLCDYRTLEIAIEYTNADIVDFLINQGMCINEDIICQEKFDYNTQISNNDPLSYASQLNKSEIVEVLLYYKVTINLFDQQPRAVLCAINNNSIEAFETLINDARIKSICEQETVRKKLFNFSLNNGANKDIMKYFIQEDKLSNLRINTDTILFNKIERYFESTYEKYAKKKESILYKLYKITSYYKYLSEIKKNEKIENICCDCGLNMLMHKIISKYYDAMKCVGGRKISIYKDCIMKLCLDRKCMNELMICENNIELIVSNNDIELRTEAAKTFLNTAQKLCPISQKLENLLKTLRLKKDIKYISNDTVEYKLMTDNDEKYIHQVLVPLMFPKKVTHYDEMFQRLIGSNCTMSETDKYIFVRDNNSNIVSIVFNQGLLKPKKWFKYYKHNIGKEEKTDKMHLFPFVLDKKLKDYGCYQKCVNDNVNHCGMVRLISFLGVLILKNIHTLGIYEFFIDSTGSLFHRFFKPHTQITDKLKNHLGIGTKSEIDDKYSLSRELMKHY